jgi:hypothetical protein
MIPRYAVWGSLEDAVDWAQVNGWRVHGHLEGEVLVAIKGRSRPFALRSNYRAASDTTDWWWELMPLAVAPGSAAS